MESADVRYLRSSLFSQNERARLCERVSFVKTNKCVNIVQKHFHFIMYIQTEIFLKFKVIYLIAFTSIHVVLEAF